MQSDPASDEDFIGRPIYLFITILIGYLVILSVLALLKAGLRPAAMALAAVGALHIGMYWLNQRLPKQRPQWMIYYVAQTGLIIAMALLTKRNGVDITVFESACICMVGEALGWWGNTRRAFTLCVFYVALVVFLTVLLDHRDTFLPILFMMLVNGGGIVLIMLLLNQQVAAREQAVELTEALESANAQLAASAAKIEALTRQSERQRMARELHDTLAQGVAGLVLQLEAAKAHLEAERPERAATIVDKALDRARSTLASSRAAIDDLRAAPRDVEREVREVVERSGVPCELDIAIHPTSLPDATVSHALAILSEALTNVSRHAEATHAQVQVAVYPRGLRVRVADNGQGFDPTHLHNGHYGLVGMHERARLMGATLDIQSAPGHGTTISLRHGETP